VTGFKMTGFDAFGQLTGNVSLAGA
jgi:hypothetical protein